MLLAQNELALVYSSPGATTMGRILKENLRPSTPEIDTEVSGKDCVVAAKCPNYVWHVDLTVVFTGADFWTSWLPLTLPQCWLFCRWVAVVVDHFSRRDFRNAPRKTSHLTPNYRLFLGVRTSISSVVKDRRTRTPVPERRVAGGCSAHQFGWWFRRRAQSDCPG